MTREEAIERINIHKAYMGQYEAPKTKAALDMAISALREQEERSKGCDFCNADYAVMSGSYMTLDFQHKSVTPKFCPKCGRRLEATP